MKKKSTIFDLLFLAVLFILTIYFVFKGEDLGQVIDFIKTANPLYWVPCIALVVVFVCSESVIIHYLMKKFNEPVKLGKCIVYSFIGFFFSGITPSASGGQPAQLYYMSKDNLSVPVSTLVLLFVTLTYKMVLVALGLIVLIFKPAFLMVYLDPIIQWCYLGIVLNGGVIAIIAFAIFKPTLAKHISHGALNVLAGIRLVKHKDKWVHRVDDAVDKYKTSAEYIHGNISVFAKVLFITTIQRFALFFITSLVYLSFGLRGTSLITIMLLQGMISVCVDMLPLPGGMGISESLFLVAFKSIFGVYTLPAMVISRGISYYTELIMSAIVTISAHIYYMNRKEIS